MLAEKAGCSIPAIRHYEAVGLMPEAERRTGGHRIYERKDLARLVLIRRCRDLNMSLDRIKTLLNLQNGGRPCAQTRSFFQTQREAVQERIKSLQELDMTLGFYIAGCDAACLPSHPCEIFDQIEKA